MKGSVMPARTVRMSRLKAMGKVLEFYHKLAEEGGPKRSYEYIAFKALQMSGRYRPTGAISEIEINEAGQIVWTNRRK